MQFELRDLRTQNENINNQGHMPSKFNIFFVIVVSLFYDAQINNSTLISFLHI